MKAMLFVCLLFANGLWADTVRTVPLLADSVNQNASASLFLLVHEVLDDSGNLKSGSLEVSVTYQLPSVTAITGIEVRHGGAGQNGATVLAVPVNGASGGGTVGAQVQFGTGAGQPDTGSIRDMGTNPSDYYLNITTAGSPAAALRGQLMPAQSTVLMGLMNPDNEAPPVAGSTASGVAGVVALRAFDPSGNVAMALVVLDLNYSGFPGGTVFTGFEIGGIANVAAPPMPAGPGGSGSLEYTIPITPADKTFAAEVDAVNGLFSNPSGYSVGLRTAANPGGAIRGQLRSTDMAVFQVNMTPQNGTPSGAAPGASAPAAVTVYTARNADATAAAAFILFDVDVRFPGATTFTGLDINMGSAGVAGPIVIPTEVDSDPIPSSTGNISIFGPAIVSDPAAVRAVTSLLENPAGFYLNLRSSAAPDGAVRGQLSAPLGAPNLTGVASASSPVAAVAPGSIVSVYGQNLSPVTSDLSGFHEIATLPTSLDGVSARIGGVNTPIFYVSPNQLNLQVPFEAPIGSTDLTVKTAAGTATTTIQVASVAPSIFIVDNSRDAGAVVKATDFSLVTPENAVKTGDVVVIYSTGLGQTAPAVETGKPVVPPDGGTFNNSAQVAVRIGSQDARVLYSIAAPGYAGLYQTAVIVPAGVSGTVPLLISVANAQSNSVSIAVQ
jgi:uncharacterized protein (TIGR03437 family)